jgi:hypothetical protein
VTSPTSPPRAGRQAEDRDDRKEDDGGKVMVTQQECQNNHRDDCDEKLRGVADEEVPPETPEGPGATAHRLHSAPPSDADAEADVDAGGAAGDDSGGLGCTARNQAMEAMVTTKNKPIAERIARSLPGQ